MKILRYGFDTIDVSFMGALPEGVLAALAGAKEAAIEQQFPEPLDIGGVLGSVGQVGKGGGYRYTFDTGPEGEIWWFKHNTATENHNIFVSVRAAQLLLKGWERVRDDLYVSLEKLGATVLGESINRVDFAIDLLAPEFELEPKNFVCAWQTKRAVHNAADEPGTSEILEGIGAENVQYIGRRCSGVTLGKMPNRQVIVYDKRREVIDARGNKDFWWDAWKPDRKNPSRSLDRHNKENKVWRIEIRAGKNHLKEQWDIRTWQDFENSILDLFMDAIANVRYVTPTGDSNAARWPNTPVWNMVRRVCRMALRSHESGIVKGRIVALTRQTAVARYVGQIKGLMAGYSVAVGEADSGELSEVLTQMVGDEFSSPDFETKKNRVRRRLIFINQEQNRADLGMLYRTYREGRIHYAAAEPFDPILRECPF